VLFDVFRIDFYLPISTLILLKFETEIYPQEIRKKLCASIKSLFLLALALAHRYFPRDFSDTCISKNRSRSPENGDFICTESFNYCGWK
jgi:hypothetical protein